MAEEKIKVRIKPFKGIGGVGDAGDEVWMTRAEVDYYLAEGFIEILPPGDVPPIAPPPVPAQTNEQETEDHQIMKPQNRRRRK